MGGIDRKPRRTFGCHCSLAEKSKHKVQERSNETHGRHAGPGEICALDDVTCVKALYTYMAKKRKVR